MRERIVLDGEPVSPERFVETCDDIAPYVQMVDAGSIPMSFFEVMVGMAYALFADAPVDVAVIEVGMGGTWDATNVADAQVAVVTPVDLDHAEYLGPDVATIAGEKAGIIRIDAIAVLAHQQPGALDALVRRAGGRGRRSSASRHRVRRAGAAGCRRRTAGAPAGSGRRVRGDLPAAVRGAPGAERGDGAGRGRGLPRRGRRDRPDRAGDRPGRLRRRPLAGRLEQVRTSPSVLVDAAHNPAGMAATVDAIKESFDFTRLIGVVGVVQGKDVHGMLTALEDVCAVVPEPARRVRRRAGRWPSTSSLARPVRRLPEAVRRHR